MAVEQARRRGSIDRLPPLMQGSRKGPLPLSFAQQRLWFIDQLEHSSTAYNIPIAVRLRGLVNIEVLASALEEVVQRHEILRTRIDIQDGRAVQVVEPKWRGALQRVNLRELEEKEQEEEVRRQARAEASRLFDLSGGVLLRARLLELKEEENVLLVTMHHIVSDGWSMGILVKEVSALYEAYLKGEPSPLPEGEAK